MQIESRATLDLPRGERHGRTRMIKFAESCYRDHDDKVRRGDDDVPLGAEDDRRYAGGRPPRDRRAGPAGCAARGEAGSGEPEGSGDGGRGSKCAE